MTTKIPESEVGCWLDGHMGWHNHYRVVERAQEWGLQIDADDERLIEIYKFNDDEEAVVKHLLEKLGSELDGVDLAAVRQEARDLIEEAADAILGQGGLGDKATEYLDSLAPDGYAFNWDMGELSLLCLCQIEGSEENEALGYHKNQCETCDARWGK